jgi:hypothetical protein
MKKMMLAFCLLVLPMANLVSQNSGTGNSIPVVSGYVVVYGGKLYYEMAGKGPNIILLHDGMVHREISTLILVGEYDIPDVHAHSGAINAGIKGSARKIIPNSGHLIPIEQPELFNEVVLDFLK